MPAAEFFEEGLCSLVMILGLLAGVVTWIVTAPFCLPTYAVLLPFNKQRAMAVLHWWKTAPDHLIPGEAVHGG